MPAIIPVDPTIVQPLKDSLVHVCQMSDSVPRETSELNASEGRCEGNDPFCLGMGDFCGYRHEPSPGKATSKPTGDSVEPKRKKLRLSLNKPPSRFERVDENEMAVICKGYVQPNMQKNTRWSLSVFNEWKCCRNSSNDKKCPDDILQCPDASTLNYWLARFVAEVRQADGKPYQLKSIHQLICGILRHMRSIVPSCPNILDCQRP